MSAWTEAETEAAMQKLERLWQNGKCGTCEEIVRAALSAAPRVPEGYWLAPDEPTDAIQEAANKAYRRNRNWTQVFRAIREAAKR